MAPRIRTDDNGARPDALVAFAIRPIRTAARLPEAEASYLSAAEPVGLSSTAPSMSASPPTTRAPDASVLWPARGDARDAAADGRSTAPAPADDTREGRRRVQIARALQSIAEAASSGTGPRAVDIVFLLDVSGSMENNIRAVGENLLAMMNRLAGRGYDATFGVVKFAVVTMRVFPQSRDVSRYERLLASIQCGGDERALDALDKAVRKVEFRDGVQRRFVLITDEPLKGSRPLSDLLATIRSERIIVDVIGRNIRDHWVLAHQTGGTWHRIPGD
jgi:Mg-chelatase subunit ChlD